jgi:flagellar hook-basal body complex protein FliE
MNPISSFTPALVSATANLPAPLPSAATDQAPFRNLLLEGLDQMNAMQHEANAAVEQLVTGGDVNPAEVLTALQKADMSFNLMLQIRNQLVQAYQEISNVRI